MGRHHRRPPRSWVDLGELSIIYCPPLQSLSLPPRIRVIYPPLFIPHLRLRIRVIYQYNALLFKHDYLTLYEHDDSGALPFC